MNGKPEGLPRTARLPRTEWRSIAIAIAVCACSKSGSVLPESDASVAENSASEIPEDFEEEPVFGSPDAGSALDAGAAQTPIPTKIRYVVVLVKENHTFDNMFSRFPGATSATDAPLSDGTRTPLRAADGDLPFDICHSVTCGQTAYAGGKMNGFDRMSKDAAKRLLPFFVYPERQIPNYWNYAREFVLADHYFSSTLGPSAPGHLTFWAAQPLLTNNPSCVLPDGGRCAGYGCRSSSTWIADSFSGDGCSVKAKEKACYNVPVLMDHLPAGFTWKGYGGAFAALVQSTAVDPNYASHRGKKADLLGDLATKTLPNLTMIHVNTGAESEHPPHHPCMGENDSVSIINALMARPEWNEMAIVLTYDDSGGFYDSVKPSVDVCPDGKTYGRGFRLPLMILSPYARRGSILKNVTEQASVPRLVEELWGIPFMTARDRRARDGVAGSLLGAFDFAQPPRKPFVLPTRSFN